MRQELVQRRIEQADRDRLARPSRGTGRRSLRAGSGKQLGRAPSRGLPRRRRGSSRGSSSMWSKNMCSVRHSPMPSAPNAIGFCGLLRLVGVGPHLQLAVLVGPAHQLVVALVGLGLFAASASCRSSTCMTSLGAVSTLPAKTSPVKPSMEIQSPSFSTLPPTVTVPVCVVDLQFAGSRRCRPCPSGG